MSIKSVTITEIINTVSDSDGTSVDQIDKEVEIKELGPGPFELECFLLLAVGTADDVLLLVDGEAKLRLVG